MRKEYEGGLGAVKFSQVSFPASVAGPVIGKVSSVQSVQSVQFSCQRGRAGHRPIQFSPVQSVSQSVSQFSQSVSQSVSSRGGCNSHASRGNQGWAV